METVQIVLETMSLLAILLIAVLPAVVMMVRLGLGAGMAVDFPVGIGRIAAETWVVIEPAGGGGPVVRATGSVGTVFFDKEDSFPERRVLYPALFVYGPTSLAR